MKAVWVKKDKGIERRRWGSGRWGFGIFSLLFPTRSSNILPTSINSWYVCSMTLGVVKPFIIIIILVHFFAYLLQLPLSLVGLKHKG